MKTIKLLAIVAVVGVIVTLTACSEKESIDELLAATEKSIELVAEPSDSCTFSGILSEADIAGLYEMREEEKLARDVYINLYKKHGHIVFNNISKSENAHTSAVLYLMKGYALEDVALEGEGEFSNPLFADLYKQLTEQGASDLVAALKVGAFIEEYDIADLWELLGKTENEDIKRVYGNLLRASEFHLKAFTNVLKVQGAVYQPSIITNEEYQEILTRDSDSEEETEAGKTTNTPPAECDGTGPNA